MKKNLLALMICSLLITACSKSDSNNRAETPKKDSSVLNQPESSSPLENEVLEPNGEGVEEKNDKEEVVNPSLNATAITLPSKVKYPVSGQSIPLLHAKWNLQAVKPKLNNNPNICGDESITPLILMEFAQKKGFVAKPFPNEHKKNKVAVPRWSDLDVKVDQLSPDKPLEYTVGIEAELDKPTSLSVMKNDLSTLWENYGSGQKVADSTDSYLYVEIKNIETVSSSNKGGNIFAKCNVNMLVAEGYRTWNGLLFADMQDLPVTSFLPLSKVPVDGDRTQNTLSKVITIIESKGNFSIKGF